MEALCGGYIQVDFFLSLFISSLYNLKNIIDYSALTLILPLKLFIELIQI